MTISDKLKVDPGKIVIFGAGRIGRSFIGQLFGCSGYKVVFIDADAVLVSLLNERRSYRVVIKGEKDEEITVPCHQAIHISDHEEVASAICSAGIAAVSVGKSALPKVIPSIAKGLEKRNLFNPYFPLDIILAENHTAAAEFTKAELMKSLPEGFPLDRITGLLETSIGKMVPIIPLAEYEKDPLVVFAEPYNTLILDGKAFKSPIPDVKGLSPKKNIKAWVDRKAFIHNLGHATAAYYGFYLHPEMIYMHEILADSKVCEFTKDVMLQSASVLSAVYPEDLPWDELTVHIDDLIMRFMNKALQDTVFRVGHDLIRKLGCDDRFMGAIHMAIQKKMDYELISKAMSYGFRFMATDEEGKMYPDDAEFHKQLDKDPWIAMTGLLNLDRDKDSRIIAQLIDHISRL